MGFSKKYLNSLSEPIRFSPEKLGAELKERFTEIEFAYLMGSSADGTVRPGSDLDLAFFLTGKADYRLYTSLQNFTAEFIGNVRIDTGILNNAEPVYRFEALKGKLLFYRDQEIWLRFYSLTCREYESALFHYQKQLLYRLQNRELL